MMLFNNDKRIKLFNKYLSNTTAEFIVYVKDNIKLFKDTNFDVVPNVKWPKQKIGQYINFIIELSSIFEECGYVWLKQKLFKNEEMSNTVIDVKNTYEKALKEADDNPKKAIETLLELVKKHNTFGGGQLSDFSIRINGLLGLLYFKTDNFKKAKTHTELSIKECEEINDLEGVKVYRNNLILMNNKENKEKRITTSST